MSALWKRILALSFIAQFCILWLQPMVRPAEAAPPPGFTLVWSDEFDHRDAAGNPTLDTNKWGYRQPGVCRRDAINIQDAVSLDGLGNLVITTYTGADGKHYTGMIQTGGASWGPISPPGDKKLVRYGYIEARIDFDGSPGMWSSFWLQSPTYGNPLSNPRTAGTEIDIVEHRVIGSSQGQPDQNIRTQAPSALHWDAYSPNAAAKSAGGDLHSGNGDLSSGFHTYGLEWTPDVLRFYYDCVLVWTVNNSPQLDPPSPTGSQSPSVLGPVSQANEFIILGSEVQNNGYHVCPSLCQIIRPCQDPPADSDAVGWCGKIPGATAPPNPVAAGSFGPLTGAPGVASTTKMKVDYVRVYQDIVPPPSLQDLSVSSPYGRTTMAVKWRAPGDDGTGETCTKYDLRYSTSPIDASNFGSATYVTSTAPPSARFFPECQVITGLAECTQYYFAIKTMDEAGNWSAISNVPSATTECDINRTATCPTLNPTNIASWWQITNLNVSDRGNTTMAVSWTAPGAGADSGKASEYDLRWSRSLITASNFASAARATIAAPQAVGSTECGVVGGLCAHTLYYFAIKAKDQWGNWSGMSNATSATTLPEPYTAVCSGGGGAAKFPLANDETPRSFLAPRPNPAHGATSFRISVPSQSQLRVGVFDVQGRQVRSLVNRIASPGPAQIEWNLLDDSGHRVASGLYMVRVDVGDMRNTFRLVVVR